MSEQNRESVYKILKENGGWMSSNDIRPYTHYLLSSSTIAICCRYLRDYDECIMSKKVKVKGVEITLWRVKE